MKSHHYIISFDPRDAADNGLTVDRAQALGAGLLQRAFSRTPSPCLHPPGRTQPQRQYPCAYCHQQSADCRGGRCKPYMDRASRHHEPGTNTAAPQPPCGYFRSEVMEMCHREGLYQIDLLNGSRNKVTEREYWAKQQGASLALDKENAVLRCRPGITTEDNQV